MIDKKTGRDRGDGATRMDLLQDIFRDFPGNTAAAQRLRLLAAISEVGFVTTTEAQTYLKVANPERAVADLRTRGTEIGTAWALDPLEAGRDPHRRASNAPMACRGGPIAVELAALLTLLAVVLLMLMVVLQ